MKGVNKVILMGNLGRDPEITNTANGSVVTRISVATTEKWTDKASGQQQERVEWHRVVFFSRLAEIVGEYLRKGSQVYIEGQLRTNKWQDKDGNDRYTTEIIARDMQMIGGRGETGTTTEATGKSSGGSNPSPAASNQAFDDDIPF